MGSGKRKVDIVFVVVTYRNTNDLVDFIKSVRETIKSTYRIIVVNSYYDCSSCKEFRKIAMEYNCDFINVPNRGYGYGNNRGIDFAKKTYDFRFLIVSNPDVEILRLDIEELNGLEDCIIAPRITTLTGKNQNPYYYSRIKLVEWIIYRACLSGNLKLAYLGIAINKLYREIRLFVDRCLATRKVQIYAAHGSFVIFGCVALRKLGTVFDERMFLFCEENHLARLAFQKSVKIYMLPSIKVLHKEDGSLDLDKNSILKYWRESFVLYYEHWKNYCC